MTRRLQTDGCLGFSPDQASITVIPRSAVKRIDFTTGP